MAEAATRAPADGYTLLVAVSSTMTINPLITESVRFAEIVKDAGIKAEP